jgi:hypothetical protein
LALFRRGGCAIIGIPKIYEFWQLQYVPFDKGEKDATNSVIISIMQFKQRKNIDITCIYQWLDTLARHKTNLNYSKDFSALENFWVCSEFMFFFYKFVKIITNINNILTISYESVSTYSLWFFSYTPKKIIINALKMIINKSEIVFRIDINQKGPTRRKDHYQEVTIRF